MPLSLYDVTIASYLQTLEGMLGVLAKGADHFAAEGIDPAEVVATRLYPDMATFHFQVTSMNHHSGAALKAFRSGEFRPPKYDHCGYEELQAMTAANLEELRGEKREEIDALAGNKLVFKIGGNEIPFTTENFALSFSLPNFYFHATTTYDILRMKGVQIGKMDFMGPMRAGA